MEILRVCLNEIALSGLEGCTFEELWCHLSSRHPPISFPLDEKTKSFIWLELKKTALRNGAVQLYKLQDPREARSRVVESDGLGEVQWQEYCHAFPYRLVHIPAKGIRGSCSTYDKRKDITASLLTEDLNTIVSTYGSTLVLVGSQELRERALFPENKEPSQDISVVQYCLLEVIGCARHYGILRTEVTKNYMRIDARSTYHHCKVLKTAGLIAIRASHKQMSRQVQQVHLLLLPHHPTPPWVHCSNYAKELSNLLMEAPSWTLPSGVLAKKLGKGYKTGRDTLQKGGYIQQTTMGKVSSSPSPSPKDANVKALTLLRPYKMPTEEEEEEEEGKGEFGEDEEEEEGEGEGGGRVPIVLELPLSVQGYQLIDSRGPEGINNAEFCGHALSLDLLCARQLSKSLIKSSAVVTILLDDEGVKKIRLVSARHITQNKDYENLQAEKLKSGFTDEDIGIRTGEVYNCHGSLKGKHSVKEEIRNSIATPSAATPGPSAELDTSGEAPVISSSLATPVSGKQVQRLDKDVEQVLEDCLAGLGSIPELSENGTMESVQVPSQLAENEDTPLSSTPSFPSPLPERVLSTAQPLTPSVRKGFKLLTYHQLKRLNIISRFLDQRKAVIGFSDITDHLRTFEREEGKVGTLDNKTAKKLLQYLLENKRLCQKVVSFPDLPAPDVVIYYTPDASAEEVAAVEEKATAAVRAAHIKKEARALPKAQKKKKKKKKRGMDDEEEDEEEEEEEEESKSEAEMSEDSTDEPTPDASTPLIVAASKFQKLRHFHYYLWILCHGLYEITPTRAEVTNEPTHSAHITEDEPLETAPIPLPPLPSSYSTFTPHMLPSVSFPWVKSVSQLPQSGRGHGWLSYSSILHFMPLSLWTLLSSSGGNINPKCFLYLQNPKHRNKLLHELPRKLKQAFVQQGRDVSCINQLLERLREMHLVEVEGNVQTNRNKAQVGVCLCEHATILDTSVAPPRRSFFLEEARSLFKTIHYTLSSLAEVERYWYQLQCISLGTPIVLIKRWESRKPRRPAVDEFSLPYDLQSQRLTSDKYRSYNQQGFGAGGLPPLFFSHLKKNWTQLTSSNIEDDDVDGMEEGQSYGPGMRLGEGNFPRVDVGGGDGGGEGGGGDVMGDGVVPHGGRGDSERDEGPPAVKRPRLGSKSALRAHVVQVPGSQIQRHSGGRGYQRLRVKQALKAAKKIKKIKVSMRYRVARKAAVLVMDKDSDEVTSRGRERRRWFSHEDSFLMLAYLASLVLRQRTKQATVSYRQIRDALHKEYETSRSKTTAAVQRRIVFFLHKRKSLSSTIDICLAEIMQELAGMGPSAPEATFPSLLSFVQRKYRSDSGFLLGQRALLPPTMAELHKNYEIVGWEEGHRDVGGASATDIHSINQALVTDLIIASLGAEVMSYDQYAAFKMFEAFPEADVKAAFDKLRSSLLIRQKRSTLGVPRHRGPLESQSFDLASSFFSKLEHTYFQGVSEEAAWFSEVLRGKREETGQALREWRSQEPGVLPLLLPGGRVSGQLLCPTTVESGPSSGGQVAAVMDVLFSPSQHVVSCEPVFPERLFEPQEGSKTTEQLLKTALGEEGEGEGEGEEEERDDEGERGEGEVSQSGVQTSRFAGTGLGTLLRVDENAVQNHGSMEIDLTLPCATLLSPLPDEQPPPQLASWSASWTDTETIIPAPLSLDDYLDICWFHLNMAEADLVYARSLYGVVLEQGVRGVTVGTLRGHSSLVVLSPIQSLEEHVQSLLNFEMVMKVGTTQDLLVTPSHAIRWCMPVQPSPSSKEVRLTPYRPWSTINSTSPNSSLLAKYRQGVLTYILANPGVSLLGLSQHFSGMLQFSGLHQILQSLEQARLIHIHHLPSALKDAPTWTLDSVYCLPSTELFCQ